jgi:flagellar motor switch protein FliG
MNKTTLEKIAILCNILGPEKSSLILSKLPIESVEQITATITVLDPVSHEESLEVLKEFHKLSKTNEYISTGGIDFAKEILYKSLGKQEADRLVEQLNQLKSTKEAFHYLEDIVVEDLIDFIKDESDFTMAIILSHMDPKQASNTLLLLDDNRRIKVVMSMHSIDRVNPDIIQTISKTLEKKVENLKKNNASIGGVKTVAAILNNMPAAGKDILSNINGLNVEMASDIKDHMFTFYDIQKIELSEMPKLMGEVDIPVLVQALRGESEETRDFFLSGMSQRNNKTFKEEDEVISKVKTVDKEKAQKLIAEKTRSLIENGVIILDD